MTPLKLPPEEVRRVLRIVAYELTHRDDEPERNATQDEIHAEYAATLRTLSDSLEAFGWQDISTAPRVPGRGYVLCYSSDAQQTQSRQRLPSSPAMTDGPVRPLTPMQAKVAALVARGADYDEIGRALGISPKTASVHVSTIADLLPNPHERKPYTCVLLWAVHQDWPENPRAA